MTPNDWLAHGGAYWVLGVTVLACAGFFFWVASALGRHFGTPNDGCLLGFCNVLLAPLGGGLGFLLARFPWFLMTAFLGAFLLPGLACVFFASRMSRPPSRRR